MKTCLTIGFTTWDLSTMAIPNWFSQFFGHWGWGILIVLAIVWILKEDTVKQASAEGIDRPSYPPE